MIVITGAPAFARGFCQSYGAELLARCCEIESYLKLKYADSEDPQVETCGTLLCSCDSEILSVNEARSAGSKKLAKPAGGHGKEAMYAPTHQCLFWCSFHQFPCLLVTGSTSLRSFQAGGTRFWRSHAICTRKQLLERFMAA